MAILQPALLWCTRQSRSIGRDSNPLEQRRWNAACATPTTHASLVLELQEFNASQVRTLKEFLCRLSSTGLPPATRPRARPRGHRRAEDLEIDLVDLHGQRAQYPFLSVLDPVLATLKDVAAKTRRGSSPNSTAPRTRPRDQGKRHRPGAALHEQPAKAIFDQAWQLVAEQETTSPMSPRPKSSPRTLLDDKRPGRAIDCSSSNPNSTPCSKPSPTSSRPKANAEERFFELEHRLQAADEYARLQAADQAALS